MSDDRPISESRAGDGHGSVANQSIARDGYHARVRHETSHWIIERGVEAALSVDGYASYVRVEDCRSGPPPGWRA